MKGSVVGRAVFNVSVANEEAPGLPEVILYKSKVVVFVKRTAYPFRGLLLELAEMIPMYAEPKAVSLISPSTAIFCLARGVAKTPFHPVPEKATWSPEKVAPVVVSHAL